MCRNIKTLFNFDPPAPPRPSQANQAAFDHAVDEVTRVARELLDGLVTNAPPRNREEEAEKARARAEKRFGTAAAPGG